MIIGKLHSDLQALLKIPINANNKQQVFSPFHKTQAKCKERRLFVFNCHDFKYSSDGTASKDYHSAQRLR
jgi:hypothetical protein